ncbi:MAG: MBL fold metallo-hydrolase [Gammaproteobacteria bacterium]|nr:MBL fold metallo-hydrolase [Gammaproteobacteria bacterium]
MKSIQALAGGIYCIDTHQHRPGLAAAYLVGEAGRYAMVECGTSPSVPYLLEALRSLGVTPDQVDYLLPTHAHLDHAGGAGALLRELPRARLVAHPRAAPHLIDPDKLIAGATAVYGAEAMTRMYGEIAPVPAARVTAAGDGFKLSLGSRELVFVDAPGHARHHYAIWDAATCGWFSGDVFGVSYRDFDGGERPFLIPTTTPVQFDPAAWNATLDRLLAVHPQRIYLTHYGCIEQPAALADDLRRGLAEYCRIADKFAAAPDRHRWLIDALTDYHLTELARLDAPITEARARQLLALDMELNVQGLEVWLTRRQKTGTAA